MMTPSKTQPPPRPSRDLLRNCGNTPRNTNGERVLKLLSEQNLQAASTFFDNNNKYSTWIYPTNAIKKMNLTPTRPLLHAKEPTTQHHTNQKKIQWHIK
jgi:hypothetical protein